MSTTKIRNAMLPALSGMVAAGKRRAAIAVSALAVAAATLAATPAASQALVVSVGTRGGAPGTTFDFGQCASLAGLVNGLEASGQQQSAAGNQQAATGLQATANAVSQSAQAGGCIFANV